MSTKILLTVLLFMLAINTCFTQTFQRKVLFEEATNASCVPCANNNPALKSYIDSKGDSIIAIKYHASFPGYDPMYLHNTAQNVERYSTYYGMNAMPWLNVDGMINDVWPFSLTNLDNAFYGRVGIPSPLLVSVADLRIAGDSIRTSILVYKPTGLPSGNYKLRVMAIEKKIIYTSPPGSNGEMVFEHVFRSAYPNTDGTVINTSAGTQNFTFTYKIHAEWKDTSMYTVAFVQNDNNKEVLNVGKGAVIPTGINSTNSEIPAEYNLAQNYPNPFNPSTNIKFSVPEDGNVSLKFYDMMGQEVASYIDNGFLKAGFYNAEFNASGLSSGIYFYTLKTNKFVETKKMMLVK
jgi:hypothetical protein